MPTGGWTLWGQLGCRLAAARAVHGLTASALRPRKNLDLLNHRRSLGRGIVELRVVLADAPALAHEDGMDHGAEIMAGQLHRHERKHQREGGFKIMVVNHIQQRAVQREMRGLRGAMDMQPVGVFGELKRHVYAVGPDQRQ